MSLSMCVSLSFPTILKSFNCENLTFQGFAKVYTNESFPLYGTCNPRVNATLQLRSKISILRYLKPVSGNNLPTPDEAGLSVSITKEVNQSVERAIASNRRAPDNGAKGKYDRQICS